MSNTSLSHTTVYASSSNYTKGRNNKILKITPHHAAMVGATAEQVAKVFVPSTRKASANYCIGNDGSLCLSVDEANRAWTSSSSTNDNQAVTIEVANSKGSPNWEVSDAAFNKLVDLCVDICKRNGISKLNFTGNANSNLTAHRYFTATACPGPYLYSKFPELEEKVNAKLSGGTTTTGRIVTITANVLNVRNGPGTNYKINTTVKKGYKYTVVEEQNGWGKLKSGAGWISLAYTK